MFTHYKTQGFILKKVNRGESDRLFTIFTKDFGKLELLARAERKIKSKLRAGLELFYLSEVEFIQGKAHKTLTDAILISNFQNLRKDLKKLAIAYKIADLLDNLVKGEESDPKIWNLLSEVFERLNNWEAKMISSSSSPSLSAEARKLKIVYYYFLWNLLSVLGYQLELYNCSLCQKEITPEKIFFSPKEGGLICQNCKTAIKTVKEINANTVKIIRILLKKEWSILKKLKVEDEDWNNLKEISNYYLSEILNQIK